MEETGDHFSLKWSDFRSTLTEGFHDFLREEMMVDVTLAAEGKFVQAHKLVLSVCSPYFKNLFKVNPCKHPIVILKDVGHNELSYMLQFMYKGEVGVKHEELPSFLKLADMLNVKGLAGNEFENERVQPRVESTLGKVRKKKCRNNFPAYEINYSDTQKPSETAIKDRILRKREKRWKQKTETDVKKAKFENEQDISGVNVSDSDSSDDPLIKLISDKVSDSTKISDFQCSLKNNFSGVSEVNVEDKNGILDNITDAVSDDRNVDEVLTRRTPEEISSGVLLITT